MAAPIDGAVAGVGAETGLNSTPQWTQNFAVGWFSLPQAVHFIDGPPLGILAEASRQKARTGEKCRHSLRPTCSAERGTIMDLRA